MDSRHQIGLDFRTWYCTQSAKSKREESSVHQESTIYMTYRQSIVIRTSDTTVYSRTVLSGTTLTPAHNTNLQKLTVSLLQCKWTYF